MTEIRCSRCRFPAHLIFDQMWIDCDGFLHSAGWRGDPVVCPVCRRDHHV